MYSKSPRASSATLHGCADDRKKPGKPGWYPDETLQHLRQRIETLPLQ
jgi:hypothetical protein